MQTRAPQGHKKRSEPPPSGAGTQGRRRASRGLGHGLQAAPWLALALMVMLWPTPARGAADSSRILAAEPGRGRTARSPSQIPGRGWSDILWRTWREFNNDRITTVAAGITFFGLLSLFPGLAAFVSLYGLFADIHDAQREIMALGGFAPRGAVVFLGEQMIRLAAAKGSTLSLTFVLSLLLSLWSANSATKALINGLNIAYDEKEKRSFLAVTLQSLAFTLGGIVLAIVGLVAVVAVPLVLPFADDAGPWLSLLRWPAMLVVIMFSLAAIYRYGPSREHARWRWVSWGGAAAAVLWLAVSFGYSWYVGHLANYGRVYGPFGAAAGAIVWLWLSTTVILLGAELNAEIEHQTAVDSTTGAPRPLGARGAVMADTLGRPTGPPWQGLLDRLQHRKSGVRPAKLKSAPTVRP